MMKPGEPQPIVDLLDAATEDWNELMRRAVAICGEDDERETVREMTERRLKLMGI